MIILLAKKYLLDKIKHNQSILGPDNVGIRPDLILTNALLIHKMSKTVEWMR